MGFYAPAQIVRDAREHDIEVRPPDVNASDWDCTLEPSAGTRFALRLGLRQIKGLAEAEAQALMAARGNGYAEMRQLWRRAGLGAKALEALARADAFGTLGLGRRAALWSVKGLPLGAAGGPGRGAPLPLFAAAGEEEQGREPAVVLPPAALSEEVVDDYRSLRLSLKAHPVSFLRAELAALGLVEAARLAELPDGSWVRLAGLVLVRQRPGSAKGVIFATLEDETGVANTIVWPDVFARYRQTVLKASLLLVEGRLQREHTVIHLVAQRLADMTDRLHALAQPEAALAPPFDASLARADEVKRPGRGDRELRDLPGRPDPVYPSRNFH
jgi:error-prone DNA polymerase